MNAQLVFLLEAGRPCVPSSRHLLDDVLDPALGGRMVVLVDVHDSHGTGTLASRTGTGNA